MVATKTNYRIRVVKPDFEFEAEDHSEYKRPSIGHMKNMEKNFKDQLAFLKANPNKEASPVKYHSVNSEEKLQRCDSPAGEGRG